MGQTQEEIDAWYRHEVLSNEREYPNLARIERSKNAYRFQQEINQ